jgi:hypothetical protein
MPGKSIAAFSENWLVWLILLAGFGAFAALALWMAGHLGVWLPLMGGMCAMLALGSFAYVVLMAAERAFRIDIERRPILFMAQNTAVSWGIAMWWGWTLGAWFAGLDRSDPDTLDAGLLYVTGAVSVWLAANCNGQLFNGALYMLGSTVAGLIAYAVAALVS